MKFGFILVGSGGHAAGVKEALEGAGQNISAIVDPNFRSNSDLRQFVSDDDAIEYFRSIDKPSLAMGIGGMTPAILSERLDLIKKYLVAGFDAPPIIHPQAIISPSSTLAPGVVALAGVIVNPNAVVGVGAILNTGSIIEHDVVLGDGTHIAPGAIVLGDVTVGTCAMVGSSAVILPSNSVPDYDLVPAQTRFPRNLI